MFIKSLYRIINFTLFCHFHSGTAADVAAVFDVAAKKKANACTVICNSALLQAKEQHL